MATVTSYTAARMQQIEDTNVVSARIDSGNLILIANNGSETNVGPVAGVPGADGQPGADGDGVVFLDPAESTAGLPDGTKVCRRYV